MRAIAVPVLLAALTAASQAALVVSKAPTSNVTCANGVCTATAADAVLNIAQIKSLLRGTDLSVVSGPDAQDIVIIQKLSWKQKQTLTLDAYRGVIVAAPVVSERRGGVTVITNHGGTGGNLSFQGKKGALSFRNTGVALVINAHRYTLVDALDALGGAVSEHPNGFFALARDVDASQDGTYQQSPVATALSGTVEGLGHTIAGLDIAYQSTQAGRDLGLFSAIDASGTLRNLKLAAPHIALTLDIKRGGFHAAAAAAVNHGKIRNVTVSDASIIATATTGGIAGFSDGDIEDSFVLGGTVVAGSNEAGGVAGDNAGTIGGSGSTASVSAGTESSPGGLAGNNDGTILTSWSTGAVSNAGGAHGSSANAPSGGLVAVSFGSIDRSWTTSAVNGGSGHDGGGHATYVLVGGLVAVNGGTISNSYAGGSAKGAGLGYVGGFVQEDYSAGTINTSYTHASVACDGCNGAAGFVVSDCPAAASDYWDTDVFASQPPCDGLTGLTTAALTSGLPSGFDPAIWAHDASINDGFPYLIDNPPR